MPNQPDIVELKNISNTLRKDVIEMLTEAKTGHTAGAMGAADIYASLYFHILNIDPKNPLWEERDRFIISNGHECPVWYAALCERGYFKKEELWGLSKINGKLQGHPVINPLLGIENTSGSLSQGLSIACGIAFAAKMTNQNFRVYVLSGDGEIQEGQTWEMAMFAPNKNLTNITWIIDRNNIQIDGTTEQVMPIENLRAKLEAFGWYVIEVDGHNHEEFINACNMAKTVTQRPTVIVAHTIPGYGVKFMEYKFEWHGKVPDKIQAQQALKELSNYD